MSNGPPVEEASDADDDDFTRESGSESCSESSSSGSDGNIREVSNVEVSYM
jgi:hypothetical protein